MGILSFFTMIVTAQLQSRFRLKHLMLFGSFLTIIGSILLPFGSKASRYWPIVFPAFSVGTIGTTILFVNANIAIFKFTPPSMAGTVGAIFNSALQLGSAVGIAAISSVQTSVQEKKGGFASFEGRAAGFWFLLGMVGLLSINIFIFMKDTPPTPPMNMVESGSTESTSEFEKVVKKDLSAA
jgi:MFS family permease